MFSKLEVQVVGLAKNLAKASLPTAANSVIATIENA